MSVANLEHPVPTVAHPRFVDLPLVGEGEALVGDNLSSMGLDSLRLQNDQYGKRTVYSCQRVRISRGAVVIYKESLEQHTVTGQHENSKANLSRGSYNGYISPATARRCKKMIEAWMHSVNCAASSKLAAQVQGSIYSTFATMTLPSAQIHDDNEIKAAILAPFIQALKRDFGIEHYFWKAEPQENGRIHFHMLLDRYIDRELFSHWWDRACEMLGYVSRYMEQSGSLFPPATNITQLPTDSKAISYVVKYLAKAPIRLRSIKPNADGGRDVTCHYYQPKEKHGVTVLAEYRPIKGRVWGCSDGVRECRPPVVTDSCRVDAFLSYLQQSGRVREIQIDRATVIVGDILGHLRKFDKWLWTLWRWHHLATFRFLYCGRGRPPSGNYYDLSLALTEVYR
jgi:hypothetical protein